MKRRIVYSFLVMFFFCILLLVPPVSPSKATPSLPPSQAQIENILQDQSSFFTENKGQWDPAILFVGDTSFGKVAFTKDAVYYQLLKVEEVVKEEGEEKDTLGDPSQYHIDPFERRREARENRQVQSQIIKLSFVESNTHANIRGENPFSHYHNYFIGNDPKKWASYCKNYAKVYYEDIWEGIDLAYFFTSEGMKYEYYVEPKADIQKLQVRVEGAEMLYSGNKLELRTEIGSIYDDKLVVYGEESHQLLSSRFDTSVKNTYSYVFGKAEKKRTERVIIDPLVYSTYLGGSGTDYCFDIAVDSNRNAYVAGQTYSTDFPIFSDAYQKTNKGDGDAFVTKLNSNGSALLYSTYLGGSDYECANAMLMDASGNVCIAGCSESSDFPITPDAYQITFNGVGDAFNECVNIFV